MAPGDRISVTTPELLTSGPDCKFEFWYHMYGNSIGEYFFLFNTYFTSVVPTALLLQCNWPITGIRRVL